MDEDRHNLARSLGLLAEVNLFCETKGERETSVSRESTSLREMFLCKLLLYTHISANSQIEYREKCKLRCETMAG